MKTANDAWAREWQRLAGSIRSKERVTAESVLRRALAEGAIGSWESVARLLSAGALEPSPSDPAVVAQLTAAICAGRTAQRCLDPWAGIGITLRALLGEGIAETAVGIEIDPEVHAVAKQIPGSRQVEWHLGDAAKVLEDPDLGSFDLVVGSPPIGLPSLEYTLRDGTMRRRVSGTYTMVLQAARLLRTDGLMLVVLPDGLFFSADGQVCRRELTSLGLDVAAAVALPLRAYAGIEVHLNLVVIAPARTGQTFVAQMDSATEPDVIARAVRTPEARRSHGVGILVNATELRPPRTMLIARQIADRAKRAGLSPTPLREVSLAIATPSDSEPAFDLAANAVYLPTLGTSDAATSPDAATVKPQNLLQIVLDPEKVDAEFIAFFLNGTLGRQLRETLAAGSTIPRISKTVLQAAEMYLPRTLAQQRATARVNRRINGLVLGLQSLSRELAERPLGIARIEQGIDTLFDVGGLSTWMEQIPYPLASVLYMYHAETEPEHRCRYLVNFFEALAVFLVDLHFMALRDRPEILGGVIATGDQQTRLYDRSSLGNWSNLLARLASATRRLLDKEPDLVSEIYSVGDTDRVSAVSSRSLVAALVEDACTYRNGWIGHAARASQTEWERRLAQAEATLERVRLALADAFRGWEMTRVKGIRNTRGVISATFERVTGTRNVFTSYSTQVAFVPDSTVLYMHEQDSPTALALGPLISMRGSLAHVENSAYFFDRLESGRVRWISYVHEAESEVYDDTDVGLGELIEELDALG